MFKYFGMASLIGAAVLAISSSVASAATYNNYLVRVKSDPGVQPKVSGNDCSGFYGSGFDACNISYDGGTLEPDDPNALSPVIAKWGSAGWTEGGDFVEGGENEFNNTVFASIDGTEFSITENKIEDPDNPGEYIPDGTWTWEYNPGDDDPVIRYWAHKQSNGFTLHWVTEAECAVMDSMTCLEQAIAIESGTWDADGTSGWSHITWYDSESDGGQSGGPVVPLPAAGFLFLTALGGMGLFRRFRRVAG